MSQYQPRIAISRNQVLILVRSGMFFIATPDQCTTDTDCSPKQLVDAEIPYVILGKLIVYAN